MNIAHIVKAAALIVPMLGVSTLGADAAAVALQGPYGLAVDQNTGSLYIADGSAGQIDLYNPATNVVSAFTKVAGVSALAVNGNGLVYAGISGATGQIAIYNAQGKLVNVLPTPAGDFPSTMTFDADNVLFESPGYCSGGGAGLNAYGGDLSFPWQSAGGRIIVPPFGPSLQLQSYTCTSAPEGASFALAYDNGQVFMLFNGGLDAYDEQTLASGHAFEFFFTLQQTVDLGFPPFLTAFAMWKSNHFVAVPGTAFAAAVDGAHNIFYSDPLGKDIAVTGKAYSNGQGGGATGVPPKKLLANLSSRPFGIAFDKARSRLYVSFPSERLVRAYAVSYMTQNGVKVPALSTPPMLIQ
ncbi:MAG: hypothetical protein ACLPSF_08070 [Methylocella sp.]